MKYQVIENYNYKNLATKKVEIFIDDPPNYANYIKDPLKSHLCLLLSEMAFVVSNILE